MDILGPHQKSYLTFTYYTNFRIEIKVFDRMLGWEKKTFWEKLKALSGFL